MPTPGSHLVSNAPYKASASLNALNAEVSINAADVGSVLAQVLSVTSSVGNVLTFEGRMTPTAPWIVLSSVPTNATGIGSAIAATAAITTIPAFGWVVFTRGCVDVRARVSTYGSGSLTVGLRLSQFAVG